MGLKNNTKVVTANFESFIFIYLIKIFTLKKTSPLFGFNKEEIICKRVDFPQPLLPCIAMQSFLFKVKFNFSKSG